MKHRLDSGRAVPWLALASATVAAVASTGAFGAPGEYALVRERVDGGEVFRLWTGHFVHFNDAHLLGDLLAFAVWATLVELESRRLLAITLLGGAPALSALILGTCPEVSHYRGLSALACALVTELLLARGLALDLDGARGAPTRALERVVGQAGLRRMALAGAVLFIGKCGYEFQSGRALLAPDLGSGVRLLPMSHVLGCALGVCAVGLASAKKLRRRRSPVAGPTAAPSCLP